MSNIEYEDDGNLHFKSVVELTRMPQSILIKYTQQLQLALYELLEERNDQSNNGSNVQ